MRSLALLCVMVVWFCAGVLVGHTKVFPFDVLRSIKLAVLGPDLTPDPAGVARRGLFETYTPDVDVVMIGDSLTERGLWADAFSQLVIANRGTGGDRADQVRARLDAVLATQPEHAFILLGINDIFAGREMEDTVQDIAAIVDRLGQAGVRVYLQSALECYVPVCGSKRDAILELNVALNRLAAEAGIAFIDVNAVLSDDTGLRLDLTYDGIHLNAKGYALWAEVLAPLMPPKQ
ncbi:MAG: GDSL-type esterase/lipase family protein [Sulfitobacter sp.]